MIKYSKIVLKYIIVIFFILSCEPNNEPEKITVTPNGERLVPIDSLKVIFYNLTKKGFDSLSNEFTKVIVTKNGIDYARAFQEMATKDTNNYVYFQQYAYKLGMEGKPNEALKYLNIGSSYTKNRARYFFDRATIWGFIEPLGHRDSLYYCMNKAVSIDSSNDYYLSVLAQYYNEDDLNDKAFITIEKAIRLNKKDTGYWNFRGVLKSFFKKDYKGGLKDLEYISYNNLNTIELWIAKALCLVNLNKIKESSKAIDIAVKINPKYAKIYGVSAIIKEKSGDHNGAIEDLKKGASLGDEECIEYMKKYDDYNKTHKKS